MILFLKKINEVVYILDSKIYNDIEIYINDALNLNLENILIDEINDFFTQIELCIY